jgi:hypothetical protein
MAGIIGIARTNEVALAASTAKTVLQLAAPANQRLKIMRWGLYFDGVSASDAPVYVRLLRQTSAGTMSSLSIVKNDASIPETLQATAFHTATGTEPTASDVIDSINIHPQGGGYEVIFPVGQEVIVSGGGRLGIECTAGASVNVTSKMVYEE